MREVIKPAIAEKRKLEAIHAYTVDVERKAVTVAVGLGDLSEDGEIIFDKDQIFDTVTINGRHYDDLHSEDGGVGKPLKGKPAGTFRKEDLWPFIDRLREERAKPKEKII